MDMCYYKYHPESEHLSQICYKLQRVSPGGGQAPSFPHARGQLKPLWWERHGHGLLGSIHQVLPRGAGSEGGK